MASGQGAEAFATVSTRDAFYGILGPEEALVCPRCGGRSDVHPGHSPLGSVGAWMGLERYTCTRCRRGFWHRSSSSPDTGQPGPDLAPNPTAYEPAAHEHDAAVADAALVALDVTHDPSTPVPPDLAALDEDLARLRGKRKRR